MQKVIFVIKEGNERMKKIMLLLSLCWSVIIFSTVSYGSVGKTNFSVEEIELYNVAEHKISGYFRVKNNSQIFYPEQKYILYLIPSDCAEYGNGIRTAYVSTSAKEFSLSPLEDKIVAFEIDIPSIPDKLYNLGVIVTNNASEVTNIKYVEYLKLGKGNEYIISAEDEANYYKIKNFEAPLSGPYMNSGEVPDAYIKIKSTYKESITLIPECTIYKRGPYFEKGNPLAVERNDKIKLKSGEAKEIKINLPVMTEPESYYIKVRFLDESGNPVSGEYYFRYVVNGATAKISSINTLYNDVNNELKIFYNLIGSSDGQNLTNTEVVTGVYRNDTNELLEKYINKSDIVATEYMVSFRIKVPEDKPPLTVYITITQDDNLLAAKYLELPMEAISASIEKFKDIKNTEYELPVKMLNSYGIISGYPDGSFKPGNTLTRAELTSIALNMLDVELSNYEVKNSPFVDLPKEHWAYKSINYAYENGIINGYGNGLVKPDNKVKYSEAITILLNVAGYKEYVNEQEGIWPNNYVNVAKEIRIVGDKYKEDFDFSMPATRANVSSLALNSFIIRRS